jgi:hypothetical protein
MQKIEYEFPDGGDDDNFEIEIEPSSAEVIGDDPKPKPKKKVEEEDDIELEIVDDVPEEDRDREPSDPPEEVTDEELESYSAKVRQRIKHFTKGYYDERRAKEQALRERQELERVARQLFEENKRLQGSVGKSRSALLEQAKKVITNEIDTAKRQYREAYESGEADRIIEAQEKLTAAQFKMNKLNSVKPEALQGSPANVQTANQAPQPSRQPAQPTVDEKTQEWAKKNDWWGKDKEMTSFALGYHQTLADNGVKVGSEEYFSRIDKRLREVFPERLGVSKETQEGGKPKPKSVVAPASRTQSPKKVTLTKTQLAIAKKFGLTPQQYAAQLVKDMKGEGNV